ncbi:unnamed protein product [Closterium sp. NIES-64]|nr:unnamed protein product [Closterium sp. NIES-64]
MWHMLKVCGICSRYVAYAQGYVAYAQGYVAYAQGYVAYGQGYVAYGQVAYAQGYVAYGQGYVAYVQGMWHMVKVCGICSGATVLVTRGGSRAAVMTDVGNGQTGTTGTMAVLQCW